MLIDWFTVTAQIVNFLLLVWLLKRFLYRSILNAIDARESGIAARLAEAEAKEKEAREQLAVYTAKLQDFEQRQESMLAQARLEAEAQRSEMLAKARADTEALDMKWREDLEAQQTAFLVELRRRAATEVLDIARRVVSDLVCLDVQECAIAVFLEKITRIDDDTWASLGGGELVFRSTADLRDETKARIRETLERRIETPVTLRFERAPGMGVGIELRGNGRSLAWNSASYLDTLEEDLRQLLESTSEAKVAEVG